MAVELKTECGELSEEQVEMLKRMGEHGAKTYVVRSFEVFVVILNGGSAE